MKTILVNGELGLMASRPIQHAAACPYCETLRKSAERLCQQAADIDGDVDRLIAEIDSLRSANAALMKFAGACLDPWPECLYDLEGDMQARFVAAGLTEERIATEAGDDHDVGDAVFYLTDLGRAARQLARNEVRGAAAPTAGQTASNLDAVDPWLQTR